MDFAITIMCNKTVYNKRYLLEHALIPMNITGTVLVPENQQCSLTVVVSNNNGSSEPYVLFFG